MRPDVPPGNPAQTDARLEFPPEADLAPFGGLPSEGAPPAEVVARFRTLVREFYRRCGRSFPWRETTDPYRILVSELMLQQTQTERVVPKYRAFVERYPGFAYLASAPLRDVLALWQGLGYNRRAKALAESASIVMQRFGGRLPADPALLVELPGIGPYTAAAVCAFAFGLPLPLIETNVRRVFLHFFFAGREGVNDREILPLVEATLDRGDPRSWYCALMDFGVMLKGRVANPNARSAHYVRQSRFENSNRQIRGRLLAYLAERERATLGELGRELPFASERIALSLAQLAAEGLVACEAEEYRLPDRPAPRLYQTRRTHYNGLSGFRRDRANQPKGTDMTRDEYIRLEATYGTNNYKPFDVVVARGKGVWVWDTDGNRYLDCVSAYGAVNHGHSHPKIHKAFIEQAEKVSIISRAFRNDQAGPFYKELCDLTGSRRVLLMNSGAEAVETALKAVRKWGYVRKKIPEGKAEVIVCADNFHGRTIAVVGFSTVEKYKAGFGPFPDGFKVIPFGDSKALKEAITPNTVAFLVEPVQGEGGVNVPPDGYLQEARKLCTAHNVSFVLDEIQTGLGRTGKLLAEEHWGVKADVTIIGKSLGGGFVPVSAVLARGDVLDVFQPGEHGSTFGGNPLACAVGRIALKVLVEENLAANAMKMGALLTREILAMNSPLIAGVRGKGMMLGIELAPEAPPADELCGRLIAEGLLCNTVGPRVVRFTPPLVLDDEEAGWALERLAKVFKG